MRKLLVLLAIASLVTASAGCSKRFQRYVGSFGAIGAVIGGTTGAVTSQSVNAGEGAIMGATGGGFVGAVLADQFDDTDWNGMEAEIARLKTENDTLLAANRAKDGLIAERDSLLASLEGSTGDYTDRIGELEEQIALLSRENDRFAREYVDMQSQLVANESILESKQAELAKLQDRLGSDIEVAQDDRRITLTILDELLFPAGKADLTAEGESVLTRAAGTIRELYPDRSLIIEGHTDNQPITHSAWKSNWELGAARSLAVLHYMERAEAFRPDMLAAVSHGETRPAASNATPEGRASNRRAVIVILPPETETAEAVHTAQATMVFDFAQTTDDGAVIR